MYFNSFYFVFAFAPALLATYTFINKKFPHFSTTALAIASLIFYTFDGHDYLHILILSISFNFLFGKTLYSRRSKVLLASGIGFNISLLGWFKYAGFFSHVISQTTSASTPAFSHHLPLGISFYTFTQIAFLVDVYMGRAKEYRFINYVLFVTYFPHLIAGPILHHREMMPQFDRLSIRQQRMSDIAVGTSTFIIGLAKKVLLADTLSQFSDPVFAAAAQEHLISFGEAWMAALTYSLQIYFDFSGYCDMAIGLSRMFGIKLPLNFASPYKSESMIDFWRRWHMTLSRFLRDYLYIPLGGNRLGERRRIVNILATMAIGGLWHGANWTFLIWGSLHGLLLALNHLWIRQFPYDSPPSYWRRTLSQAVTLICIVIAWVFFRADNISTALHLLIIMVSPSGMPSHQLASLFNLPYTPLFPNSLFINGIIPITLVLGIGWGIALFAPNTQQIMARYLRYDNIRPARFMWRPNLAWACILATIFILSVSEMSELSPFLYFNF